MWIDISRPLESGMPQWPGDPPFTFGRTVDDGVSLTMLSLCAHTGTHVDAPLHYLEGGAAVESLALDALIGPATLCEIDALRPAERLLLRTRDGCDAISVEQAEALVDARCRLVGIDSLSIGDADVHRTLLRAGVVILEGLDLSKAEPGSYDLVCLPIKVIGADGAPARAVIRPRSPSQASSPSSCGL
jgi:arylformamidase